MQIAQEAVRLSNESVDQITTLRTNQWRQALDHELQHWLSQASEIRALISTAKTDTKRKFYAKKFKKIQAEVLRMLMVQERLKSTTALNEDVQVIHNVQEPFPADTNFSSPGFSAEPYDAQPSAI